MATTKLRSPEPAHGAQSDGPSTPMRRHSPWVSAAVLVALVVVAQLAGIVGIPFTDRETGGWYDSLDKPPFNPPSWVFGPVWTTLYLLIGVAAWLVWRSASGSQRRDALTWWGIQLVANAIWTPIFFGAEAPLVALYEIIALWVAAAITLRKFAAVDRLSAGLFAPYLAWVTFAVVLNASIVVLNA